jgi:hypothetical protein
VIEQIPLGDVFAGLLAALAGDTDTRHDGHSG